METFKSTNDKLEDLGFIQIEENSYGILYEKHHGHYRQKVHIFKKSGEVVLQSYDPDTFDENSIGNVCVGLTYDELKLFIKKMEEFKSKNI